ncbi:hypothetical protein FDJ62_gp30 [Acinetobacter phage Loki]|uniref:Uncharacterized protein n=1 Tax=Acinetobacter phage Loki TaxID=1970374 RepID=A0A0P1KLD9_9CAUD|nr:hypothetical protein FDJ62_gp30 [Acinetobacter phage Loki]CUS06491.1 hypothetical protein [Acinetobacter phage Loki]
MNTQVQTMDFSQVSNDNLITGWSDLKEQMNRLKAQELEMRNEIIKRFFSRDLDKEGTINHELGRGWKLKAEFKKTYGFTTTEDLNAALDKLEDQSPEFKLLVERLVGWSPKLSVSEYKKLPDDFRKIIDEVIVIKPSQPTVTLVEPKTK